MAGTQFWMYPNVDASFAGSGGWTVDPTAAVVAKPYNAPDDSTFGASQPLASPLTFRAAWEMTPPAAAVVITKVSLYARLWSFSENPVTHDLTNVRGFSTSGGTAYFPGTQH